MWTSYGRGGSLAVPFSGWLSRLERAELLYGPIAVAALFAYPNPLVPVALALLAVSLGLRIVGRAGAVRTTPVDVGFALFTLGALLGLAGAHSRDAAALRFTGLLGAVGVFYLGLGRLRDATALRRWTIVLLGLVSLGVLITLALLRGQLPDSSLARALAPLSRPFGLFPGVSGDTLEVNARFAVHQYGLAYLLLVGGSFAAAAATFGGSRQFRLGGMLVLGGLLPLLLATQARGAILALAVGGTAVVALRTRWAWAILPVSGAGFYVLLARGVISRSIEAEWLSQRLSYWTGTLGLLGDFPFSGSGLGMRTFAEVFAWYHGLPNEYAVSHTHNIYLQAYAEQGLPGLIGLLILLVVGTGLGFRAARRPGPARWALAGAAGALLGSAVYGLTDQVPSTNLGLGLMFGLLAIVVGGDNLTPVRPSQPWKGESPPPTFPGVGKGARGFGLVLLAIFALALAPRWASGLLLNWGSVEMVGAALDRSRDGEVQAERLARAEWALRAATGWNVENVAARRNLGWTHLLRNDIPGAHAQLALPYRSPITPFERAQIARLAGEAGLIELAVDALKGGDDQARLGEVAERMMATRRWHEAAYAYAALAELRPDEAEYVSNTALAVLNGGGSAEEAMGLLHEAVAKNPGAARNLSRRLLERGDPYRLDERRGGGRLELARFWFSLASQVDPSWDRPEVDLGEIHYYRGLYEDAERHFQEASRRDPRNASTYTQLANTSLQLGRVDEAIRWYERAVGARPERPELRVNLARLYLQGGRRDDALGELRAAAGLDPTSVAIREELERVERGE